MWFSLFDHMIRFQLDSNLQVENVITIFVGATTPNYNKEIYFKLQVVFLTYILLVK